MVPEDKVVKTTVINMFQIFKRQEILSHNEERNIKKGSKGTYKDEKLQYLKLKIHQLGLTELDTAEEKINISRCSKKYYKGDGGGTQKTERGITSLQDGIGHLTQV